MSNQSFNIIFKACKNQYNTIEHTDIDMIEDRYMTLYCVTKYQYHVRYISKW